MPELAEYATAVLSAYGVCLLALGALTLASLRRAAAVRRRLEQVETRMARHDDT